jgi:hypothetical protein
MDFDSAKAIALRLGFSVIADVRGKSNIDHLFEAGPRSTKKACGIYLQIREGDLFYIGKSVDIRRRYRTHRAAGVFVCYLAYRLFRADLLRKKEKEFIAKAKKMGLGLCNIQCNVKSNSEGQVDFLEFYPLSAQRQFIDDLVQMRSKSGRWSRLFGEATRAELADWEAFSRLEGTEELLNAARNYVHVTIPCADETVERFWQCGLMVRGCTSSSKKNSVIRIHPGRVTSLEIFSYHGAPHQYFVSLLLSKGYLSEALLKGFNIDKKMPWIRMETTLSSGTTAVKTTGGLLVEPDDTIRVEMALQSLGDSLAHPVLAAAAAIANLAYMNSTQPFSNDHNAFLAFKLMS